MKGYPKFLYSQNEICGSDIFLVHTELPRFIAKRFFAKDMSMFEIEWVEDPGENDTYMDALIVELQTGILPLPTIYVVSS